MTVQNLTSVIMVTYHTGNVLHLSIASVLAQSANIELIIVNNGNPPEVEEELVTRFRDDPSVRLMTGHGNIGLTKGNNLGARVAQGEYLLFLNPRAVITTDTVARMLEEIKGLKKPCMLGARLVNQRDVEQRGSRRAILSPTTAIVEAFRLHRFFPDKRLRLHEEPVPVKTTGIPAISSRFMFLSAKDFMETRCFNEDYFNSIADMDFCLRFRERSGQVCFVPSVNVILMDKPPVTDRVGIEKEKARSLTRYFHNNFSDDYFQPFLWGLYLLIWLRGWLKAKAVS